MESALLTAAYPLTAKRLYSKAQGRRVGRYLPSNAAHPGLRLVTHLLRRRRCTLGLNACETPFGVSLVVMVRHPGCASRLRRRATLGYGMQRLRRKELEQAVQCG